MTKQEVEAIVKNISFRDWEFRVLSKGDGYLLQVRFWAEDVDTGLEALQSCRKWYISSHAVPQEVVRTAYKAVQAAMEHEVAEAFKYRGKVIYNPHLDFDTQEVQYRKTMGR